MVMQLFRRALGRKPAPASQQSLGKILISPEDFSVGASSDWSPTKYGEYYATSLLIYSAVKLRADAVLRLPFRLYTLQANGDKTPLPEKHPYSVLMRKVNPFWTGGDLWRATVINHSLWGSAFWWLRRNGISGPPEEIWSLRPDKVRVIPDPNKYIAGYKVSNGGRETPLLPGEILWFRDYNPIDEYGALAPIAPLRLSIDMANDALISNRNLFRNGLLFGNVAITTQSSPTDEQVAAFYKALKHRFAGSANAFNPIILNEGMDAKNLGFSPHDMEHLQTLRWSLEDVSRAFNIPKIMLGDLEKSTYANIDAAERIFWRGIATYVLFLQEEINEMLSIQFGENLFGEFDLSFIEALQPDIAGTALREREDVKAGILTINEVRTGRNLPPVPWGDDWWHPVSVPTALNGEPASPTQGQNMLPSPVSSKGVSNNGHHKGLIDKELDQDNIILEAHIKRHTTYSRTFMVIQKQLFKEQRLSIVTALHKSPIPSGALRTSKAFPSSLFDPDRWIARFHLVGRPTVTAALQQSADDQARRFQLGSFDLTHPGVQDWLNQRIALWSKTTNEETARLLMEEIVEAQRLGEGIKEIQIRIEKVFDFNDAVRSERIARTEIQAVSNRGALEIYNQSKVVKAKRWIATLDERTREPHREAHGQTVPLEVDFIVNGESVSHPGAGSAGNSINCRCTISPII